MATQAELAENLEAVAVQVTKVNGEIGELQGQITIAKQEIVRLGEIITAGGQITPELEAAFDKVRTAVQLADDKVPDVVPTVEPTP